MSRLKINLAAIEREGNGGAEDFCADGVRIGSLLVSSGGLRDAQGNSYVLSLNDMEVVDEAKGGFLGKGSSGAVRRAIHRGSNAVVALKEIKVAGRAHINEIRRELETLHAGDYATRYLVGFYGAFAHEGSVYIAMEAMDGSLQELRKPLPLRVLASVTRLMVKGLTYLHRTRHLIHRDLKPSNVLYKGLTGDIKISDFGVSSNLESTKDDAHSFVGTVTYMSPERLRGDHYSYAADIWSLGLVVAELAIGVCPYACLRGGSSEARFWALLQHLNGDGDALALPEDMDADERDFIYACVAKAPEVRPTCTDLLHHPFITKNTSSFVPPDEGASVRGAAPAMAESPPALAVVNPVSPLVTPFVAASTSSHCATPTGESEEDVADRCVIARWISSVKQHKVKEETEEGSRETKAHMRCTGELRCDDTPSNQQGGVGGSSRSYFESGRSREGPHHNEPLGRGRNGHIRDGERFSTCVGAATGTSLLGCDEAQPRTDESSVNLDDELNRLLL